MPEATDLSSPLATPIGRRRALAVIGSSVAGLALIEACAPAATPAPRAWLPTDVDPVTITPDQPVAAPFSGSVGGVAVAGSAWLVRQPSGDLRAFDPRCTHAACAYEPTDERTFSCLCHEAFFDFEGAVLSGPPPRPLDQLAVRETGAVVEIEVPADFATPRPED